MIAARIASMVKIPFAWRVGDCSWAWRAGLGRVRSEARRPLQGGGLGGRASRGVVGVGIVLFMRGVAVRLGFRRMLASVSGCGLRVRSKRLVVRGPLSFVVRQLSNRSSGDTTPAEVQAISRFGSIKSSKKRLSQAHSGVCFLRSICRKTGHFCGNAYAGVSYDVLSGGAVTGVYAVQ
jgi:hypothetical protein